MKKSLIALILAMLTLVSCTVTEVDKDLSPPNSEMTEKQDNVFSLDTLPDIGVFTGKAVKERYFEEYNDDFVPSDEYGKVIPFMGNYKMFAVAESPDWNYEQGYGYYGFCDENGKIIMDASSRTNYVNYFEADDGFGYYTVSRDIEQKEDAYDEFYSSETWLIPADGSWIKKLRPGSWVSSVGGGIIVTCSYPTPDEINGKPKCSAFDYEGKELFVLDGVDSVGVYSGGYMTVTVWGENDYSQYYIDRTGRQVSPAYKSCGNFSENGVAYVCGFDGIYYLIDTEGNRLTERDYDQMYVESGYSSDKKVYSARHADNNKMRDILDVDGNLLGTVTGPNYLSFRFPDNGEMLYYYTEYDKNEDGHNIYSTERMVWKRLSDGSDFVSKETGESPNDYSGDDNMFVRKTKNEDGTSSALIMDGDGATLARFEDFTNFMDASDDARFILYSSGDVKWADIQTPDGQYVTNVTSDTRKMHIYDTVKGENIACFEGGGYMRFAGEDNRYVLVSIYGEDYGAVMMTNENHFLYDLEENRTVLDGMRAIDCVEMDGKCYFNTASKSRCVLYDDSLGPVVTTYID